MDRLRDYVDGSDPKFLAWMRAVDAAVSRKVGLSVMDLADIDFVSLFVDGVRPGAAANMAIKESM